MELEQAGANFHYLNGDFFNNQNQIPQNYAEANNFYTSSINFQQPNGQEVHNFNNQDNYFIQNNQENDCLQQNFYGQQTNNYYNNNYQEQYGSNYYYKQQEELQTNDVETHMNYQDNRSEFSDVIQSQLTSTIQLPNLPVKDGFEIYHKQYSIDEEDNEGVSDQLSNGQSSTNQSSFTSQNNNSLATKNQEQLKVVEFGIQLLKPVLERANFYLIGDISIDFELLRGKESRFSPLSEFRPVVSVQRNVFQQFVELQIGQYQQGLTDFRGVVEKLNCMNDQFAHGIAVLLTKYQKLIDFKVKMLNSTTNSSYSGQFNEQAFWEEAQEKMKSVLAEKRKENKYLAYILKRGSYLEDVMVAQGYSEQLLEVMGLDYETFRQISLRKGLIDFVEPISRYFIIVEQFANVAKKKMPWEDICLISIDNFKIPVKVKAEKITLNKYKCYENYIGFLSIDIPQKVLDDLKLKRYRARNMLENKNYFQLGEELTYSFETELFLDRYYSQQKAQAIIEYSQSQKKKNEEENIEMAKLLQQYIQQYNQIMNNNQQNQKENQVLSSSIQSVSTQMSLNQSLRSNSDEQVDLGQSIYLASSLSSREIPSNKQESQRNLVNDQNFGNMKQEKCVVVLD
ncbi:hypothetical protein TTHERM_00518690 (macronuclear) [Tetrahymena thermophila SB210]|uniref:Uncharacterized protein n=1 Tax=Tetrahymena thermophila (strain SB210) TaxID=312017 RepID=I7MIW3_TETTS|nr:hypothetical protein TTHERM_00518690 [Tetrahymena thermophila SB210]EAR95037.1 hypothetical protein TTHERM_00518690 [Tetrahymena thermophila SB210]|eukprot:XP_001015282.1 hypothetical protein TTHERM_00518690 [Tetrahymena thermophila SB210]